MKKLKFKLKKGAGSVNRFTDEKGVKYYPGDIVDLPARYKGVAWLVPLEPVEAERKVKAKPGKVEAPAEAVRTPLAAAKPKRMRKKRR